MFSMVVNWGTNYKTGLKQGRYWSKGQLTEKEYQIFDQLGKIADFGHR